MKKLKEATPRTLMITALIMFALAVLTSMIIFISALFAIAGTVFLVMAISRSRKLKEQPEVAPEAPAADGNIVFEKKDITDGIIRYYTFRKVIAIDFETTGLSPSSDRIIEIGAVVFEQEGPVDSFGTLVNPEKVIPPAAIAVNHITNDMVASAPDEKTALSGFLTFINSNLTTDVPLILVAHNAAFDIGFLRAALERNGLSLTAYYVDTLSGSRKMLPDLENHKLGTVADYYGITNKNAHRAVTDAEVTGHIFRHLASRAIHDGK